MKRNRSGRAWIARGKTMWGRPLAAFTLIELLIVLGIISILALSALPGLLRFQTRAKVSAGKNNLRVLVNAVEVYYVDHGVYPTPAASPDDPFGILSHTALRSLTTPVAYLGASAFRDPFGTLRIQLPPAPGEYGRPGASDPFRPPTPGFNAQQSLLCFHYPSLESFFSDPIPLAGAYAVVSVGPDLRDSFIVYYPFPNSLPPRAAFYGIHTVDDTIYDPTNGTISGGDLAAFGGPLPVPRLVGGGD